MTKRPVEQDYTSYVAYTRALEEYCDALAQPAVAEPHKQEPVGSINLIYGTPHVKWLNKSVKHGEMLYKNPYINEVDQFLLAINLDPKEYRAEGGWINAPKVCMKIVERFTAAQRKPLTDEQLYQMYNEPCSDAEMLEFARAIENAHGIKE